MDRKHADFRIIINRCGNLEVLNKGDGIAHWIDVKVTAPSADQLGLARKHNQLPIPCIYPETYREVLYSQMGSAPEADLLVSWTDEDGSKCEQAVKAHRQ